MNSEWTDSVLIAHWNSHSFPLPRTVRFGTMWIVQEDADPRPDIAQSDIAQEYHLPFPRASFTTSHMSHACPSQITLSNLRDINIKVDLTLVPNLANLTKLVECLFETSLLVSRTEYWISDQECEHFVLWIKRGCCSLGFSGEQNYLGFNNVSAASCWEWNSTKPWDVK